MRKNISVILTIAFIIMSVTGIILLFEHVSHEMRHSSDHHLTIRYVHELVGILFIVTGLLHLKFNFKAILSYIGIKRK